MKKTIIPPTEFRVNSAKKYNVIQVMTEAMPNLQQITIRDLEWGHAWRIGEDPDEEQAGAHSYTANWRTYDIEIISNFSKLRELKLEHTKLNGRYPVFFNFPLLQKLSIIDCKYLKWDLGMLAGLPLLKELECDDNQHLDGNISSLRVLKGTIEKLDLGYCKNVEGNFMDLADFPHLKGLNLEGTAVTGDIRDISDNDFLSLENLDLPKGVYGGWSYEIQRISDAPDIARAVYLFIKQRPALEYYWYGQLSEDSPEWYESGDRGDEEPPLYIHFVEAGSRLGYRWGNEYEDSCCEVNWLDPEPDRESGDCAKYIEELQQINAQVGLYRGCHQPPTEEEYNRLYGGSSDEENSVL